MTGDVTVKDVSVVSPGLRASIVRSLSVVTALVIVIGGVVVGALRRGESRALLWLTASIAAWFVPDTAYSLISGYWQNAVFNLLFAAAFGVALWQGARRRTPAMSRSER